MGKSDFIEAYYFTKDRSQELKSLIDDFPQIFSEKPIVPINFSLLNHDRSDQLRTSSYASLPNNEGSKGPKFSSLPSNVRANLKRGLLCDAIKNKEKHEIFQTLSRNGPLIEGEEEKSEWIYIDEDKK